MEPWMVIAIAAIGILICLAAFLMGGLRSSEADVGKARRELRELELQRDRFVRDVNSSREELSKTKRLLVTSLKRTAALEQRLTELAGLAVKPLDIATLTDDDE